MQKDVLKKLKKAYNGAVFQFNPPKTSSKSIRKICNTTHLSKKLSSEEIIREIRK